MFKKLDGHFVLALRVHMLVCHAFIISCNFDTVSFGKKKCALGTGKVSFREVTSLMGNDLK